jgi:S-DNA-T family DNA segregation ATPase FtsK/SpoIIIE
MKGNRWVDPAPFEGYRPRVPWWAYLPGWTKVVAAPFALAWVVLWLVVRLVLLVIRYPVTVVGSLAGYLMYANWGLSPLVLALLSLVCGLVTWWGLDRASFLRHGWYRLLTEWRRATVYVPQWRTVMRLSDLAERQAGQGIPASSASRSV